MPASPQSAKSKRGESARQMKQHHASFMEPKIRELEERAAKGLPLYDKPRDTRFYSEE